MAEQVRDVLATYEKQRDLILLGAYQRGTDRKVDFAIDNIDAVQGFLKQGTQEKTDFQETLSRVNKLFAASIMNTRVKLSLRGMCARYLPSTDSDSNSGACPAKRCRQWQQVFVDVEEAAEERLVPGD